MLRIDALACGLIIRNRSWRLVETVCRNAVYEADDIADLVAIPTDLAT